MDSNDELANLHVIKFAMKHVAQLQKLKRSADGQPRKKQYQHCSKKGQCKEDNPRATQGDIATLFWQKWKISIARRTVGDITD